MKASAIQRSPAARFSSPSAVLLALTLAWLTACGGAEPEPVARLELQASEWRLPYPEWRTVDMVWRPLQAMSTQSPWCFVHLKNEDGELVRTFDHAVEGEWTAGEEVAYELTLYQSVLAPGLPPGTYDVELGLYDPASGDRWALEVAGAPDFEDLGKQAYRVARIEVPQATPDAPRLTFSTGWSSPAPGSDKQILARRWLHREGQLTVGDLDVPGSLWMRLRVPSTSEGAALRVVDDSAGDQPKLELTSTCTGRVHSLEVPGVHDLVLPVYAAPAAAGTLGGDSRAGLSSGLAPGLGGGLRISGEETVIGARRVTEEGGARRVAGGATSCELQFWSNFEIEVEPGNPPRSVALDTLSWTAAQL